VHIWKTGEDCQRSNPLSARNEARSTGRSTVIKKSVDKGKTC
jgi:hypothetical protein